MQNSNSTPLGALGVGSFKPVIGITAGAFDLTHCGHLLAFREMRQTCNALIVCLHIDPSLERPSKNKPVETAYERYIRLESCRYVDKIIPYQTEEDLINILNNETYTYRFLSTEYISKDFTGKDIYPERIKYNTRIHNYSSSELRRRLINDQIAKDLS